MTAALLHNWYSMTAALLHNWYSKHRGIITWLVLHDRRLIT
jgi:hypothetical protein